jgi:phospholipid transport system substrate-binding protein
VILFLLLAATPLSTVKSGNEQLQKLLPEGEAAVEKLAAKADEFIDFAELAKRAMGEQWIKLSPKQQAEFTATMKGLLRASYARKAISQGGNGDVQWGEEKVKGNEATVASSIMVDKTRYPIDYKLYKAPAGWKIYDVVTDGVSLVDTYSDQFRNLIAKKGYEGLLTTLKARKEQLTSSAEPSRAPSGAR